MTQTVPDISPLMPMHQDPLLVYLFQTIPSGAEAGQFQVFSVYIISANAMAPNVAISSADTVLIMRGKWALVFYSWLFRPPVPS